MSDLTLRSYDITLAAGEVRILDAGGAFVSCYAASLAEFLIAFNDLGFLPMSQQQTFRPGDGFRQIRLKNPNANGMTLRLYIGHGDIDDNRPVTTTPQGVALSTLREHLDGIFQARLNQPVTVGETSCVELLNPSASTKTLLLHRLYLTTSSATTVSLSLGDGPRLSTADQATALRLSDGSAGAAETRIDTNGPGIASGANVLRNQVTMSTGALEHEFNNAAPLTPGRSLYAFTTGTNVSLQLFVEYQEVLA